MNRRGFTLLELAGVLALMGILASVAAPSIQQQLLRGRTTEARTMLAAIADAELAYRRDHRTFVACAPSVATPPAGGVGTFDGKAAGWAELGIAVSAPVRYRYEVSLSGSGFEAIAVGDLDGDGVPSRLSLRSETLEIVAKDELE